MNPYIIQPTQMQQTTQAVGTPDDQSYAMQQQTPYTPQVGNNLMQLAMALRGGHKKKEPNIDSFYNQNVSQYMPWNQLSTANQYGTNPYSQQSLMLAQQDAGMK
jgi:hypothetical protein